MFFLDEEDLMDSQKKIKIPKVNDERFKINFSWIFIVCIMIMIADQIMRYLDCYPELFYGGDYAFHILQSAISICSQLSVSVAAAVIFYYAIEFINEKKKMDDFIEIRKYIIFILYKHMDILYNIESFKKLNRDKKRLNGDDKLFLIVDIPILLECYKKCSGEKIKVELNNYFSKIHENTEKKRMLLMNLELIQQNIEALLKYKHFSFYKGYRKDIENLKSVYGDMKDYIDTYDYEDNINNLEFVIVYIIEDYINFLEECIHVYHIVERYIMCLEDKRFVEFMRMLG